MFEAKRKHLPDHKQESLTTCRDDVVQWQPGAHLQRWRGAVTTWSAPAEAWVAACVLLLTSSTELQQLGALGHCSCCKSLSWIYFLILLIELYDFIDVEFDSKTHSCLEKVGCVEPSIYRKTFFTLQICLLLTKWKPWKRWKILNERTGRVSETVTRLSSCF